MHAAGCEGVVVDQFIQEDISSLLEIGFASLSLCPLSDGSTGRTKRDGDRFERLRMSLETSSTERKDSVTVLAPAHHQDLDDSYP